MSAVARPPCTQRYQSLSVLSRQSFRSCPRESVVIGVRKYFSLNSDAALCHIAPAHKGPQDPDTVGLECLSIPCRKTWQGAGLRYNVRATAPRNGPVLGKFYLI